MRISARRVNALVIKEFKDLARNLNVFVMWLMPIIGAIVLSFIKNLSDSTIAYSVINLVILNCCLVSPIVMAMIIAEEKEKNTMRTLMLSGITPVEFLLGKAAVTWLITLAINAFIYFQFRISFKILVGSVVISMLFALIMIIIGAVIGMYSKNLMSAGTNSMPITMLFVFIPMYSRLNKGVELIAKYLPSYHSQILLNNVFKGEGLSASNILPLFVWLVIAVAIFALAFKKRRFD